jgi:hypothetical protein
MRIVDLCAVRVTTCRHLEGKVVDRLAFAYRAATVHLLPWSYPDSVAFGLHGYDRG